MKLPASGRAIVEDAKVRDHLLSPERPVGRLKARVFMAVGYRRENWQQLQRDVLAAARTIEVQPSGPTAHGQRYVGVARLTSPSGVPLSLTTVWINTFWRRAAAAHGLALEPGMTFNELEAVVLERDLPEHGLRKGDLGAVVHVHSTSGGVSRRGAA